MATSFTTTGDWTGKITAPFETATQVAGLPVLANGSLYRRKIYNITRTRYGQDIQSFDPESGDESAGNLLTFISGTDSLTGNASDTYMCLTDDAEPDPPGSNIWRQTQVWVAYTDWEEYELQNTIAS